MHDKSILNYIKQINRARLARRNRSRQSASPACNQEPSGSPMLVHIDADKFKYFHFRPESIGDKGVIKQIFIDKDYQLSHWEQGRELLHLANSLSKKNLTSLIIDAGANIGASALFFHETLPASKIICIEPDKRNYHFLNKNVDGCNAVTIEGAVASQQGQLQLIDPGHSDWGFRTTNISDNVSNGRIVPCLTIDSLISQHGKETIPLIAKIDIEGAEADLFKENCSWIDNFPCIIIELHDWMLPGQGSSRNFFKQIASRNFDFLHRGENIFLFNMTLIHSLQEKHAS